MGAAIPNNNNNNNTNLKFYSSTEGELMKCHTTNACQSGQKHTMTFSKYLK